MKLVLVIALAVGVAACDDGDWALDTASDAAPDTSLVSKPAAGPDGGRLDRSTVHIRAAGCDGSWTGSGFLVAGGVVVTNRHVVDGARSITVTFHDGTHPSVARVERVSTADIGLVTLGPGDRPYPLVLAAEPPEVGDTVSVRGYPLDAGLHREEGRVVGIDQSGGAAWPTLRMSAVVRPGSSGGPVTRADGQVVGVVHALERAVDYSIAVPAAAVIEALAYPFLREPALGCE
ncbi:MAG TPA: trypsin-like peptidase domain-containing protein [Acidimicrobiales bacterium]